LLDQRDYLLALIGPAATADDLQHEVGRMLIKIDAGRGKVTPEFAALLCEHVAEIEPSRFALALACWRVAHTSSWLPPPADLCEATNAARRERNYLPARLKLLDRWMASARFLLARGYNPDPSKQQQVRRRPPSRTVSASRRLTEAEGDQILDECLERRR